MACMKPRLDGSGLALLQQLDLAAGRQGWRNLNVLLALDQVQLPCLLGTKHERIETWHILPVS